MGMNTGTKAALMVLIGVDEFERVGDSGNEALSAAFYLVGDGESVDENLTPNQIINMCKS